MRRLVLSVGLPLLLALTLRPAAAEETAGYAEHFGATHRTLLVIPDLVPRLRALVESPRFKRIMVASRFGRALQAMPGGGFDVASLRSGLEEIEPYVPREIVLGLSERGLADLARILEIGVYAELFLAALSSDDEAVLAQLPAVRTRLFELVRDVRMPDLVVWVRLRGEAEAQTLAMLAGFQLRALAGEDGVTVRSLPAGIEVSAKVEGLLGAGEARLMAQTLAGEDAPEAQVTAFETALNAITLSFRLERFGDGLRLALGAPLAADAPRLDPTALGPLFAVDDATWLVTRWEIGAVKEQARRFREAMDTLRGTPLGRLHATMDESGVLDGMVELARVAEASGTSGTMRMRSDGSLHVRIEERGVPEAGDPVALVPSLPPADTWFLDGTETLGSVLAAFALAIEDRLALRTIRQEILDEPAPATDLEAAYYAHFGDFRRALYREFPGLFREPAAVVLTRGSLQRLAVHRRGAPPAVKEGVPIPEVAVLGRTTDADAALEGFGGVWGGLAAGCASAAGREASTAPPPLLEADLGLGTRAYVLNGVWLRTLLAGEGLRVEAEGDFRPHVFIAGDLFVLSSSVRLSRAILAARRGEGPRLALPDAEGRLVSCGRIPGTAFSSLVLPLLDVAELLMQSEGAGAIMGRMGPVREFAAGLFEILDRAEWTVTDARDLRTTEFHAHFIR